MRTGHPQTGVVFPIQQSALSCEHSDYPLIPHIGVGSREVRGDEGDLWKLHPGTPVKQRHEVGRERKLAQHPEVASLEAPHPSAHGKTGKKKLKKKKHKGLVFT